MQRKRLARNNLFFKKTQLNTERTILKEEFLDYDEIKILIAEFLIFMRLSRLITNYTPIVINQINDIEIQNDYSRHLLIKKISSLHVSKRQNWRESAIKNVIQPLLDSLILPKQKNDDWAMQYLAHLFSNHTKFQLFFYISPRLVVRKRNMDALLSMKRLPSKIELVKTRQSSVEYDQLLLNAGIPNGIVNLFSYQLFAYNIIYCLAFALLAKPLPPIFNSSILTFFFEATLAIYLYIKFGRHLIFRIMHSPFSWKLAGEAIQIGLMDEINNELLSSNEKPKNKNDLNQHSNFRDEYSSVVTISYELTSISKNEFLSDEYEKKHKEKRRSNPASIPQSISSSPLIKVSWENPTIEPLYGILQIRNNKADIDFLLKDGISRGWSTLPRINSRCSNHLFFQPENDAKDALSIEFRRIISLAHVVPTEAHPGLVQLKKNDVEFPGAQFKAKSRSNTGAKWRVGLFETTHSNAIKFVHMPDQQLPENLINKVFYLHNPGPLKCTH